MGILEQVQNMIEIPDTSLPHKKIMPDTSNFGIKKNQIHEYSKNAERKSKPFNHNDQIKSFYNMNKIAPGGLLKLKKQSKAIKKNKEFKT